MTIEFVDHPTGGVVGDFSVSLNTGDIDLIPAAFALLGLPIGTVVRFSKSSQPGKRVGVNVYPTTLADGSYAVRNGVAEYRVDGTDGPRYEITRLET